MNPDSNPSEMSGATPTIPAWVHVGVSVVLLVAVSILDVARPFDRSWSILYVLVAIYISWCLRGRAELLLLGGVIVATFFVPIIFHSGMLWQGAGLFYRTTGLIAGLVMVGLMWDRRRFIAALHASNIELERKVASRTSQLQTSNETLRREISDRQHAEEELQMMRFCVDHAGENVFWISPNGRILYINDSSCTLHGYSREELLEMTVFNLDVEPDYQPGTWEKHFEELKRRKTITLQTHHRAKDGHVFPVEVNANYVRIGDNEFNFAFLRDITERKRIEEELKGSRQRLEVLSRQLITTQETERRHLARELHDEIGQVLTAIKMNLRRTQRAADALVQSRLEENVALVDQAIGQVRNLALSLRPAQLDELGLVAALHWLVKQQAGLGGFEEELDVDLGDIDIPADLQTVCFRIAQEALTNAIRHGKPRKVHARLWAEDHRLFLSVRDDGVGFDLSTIRQRELVGSSFGLVSIQERASLVGGLAEIQSIPGQGTIIDCWFPLTGA